MSNPIGLHFLVCLQRSVGTINGLASNRTQAEGIALRFAVNLKISCASLQLFFFSFLCPQRVYPVRSLSGIVLL